MEIKDYPQRNRVFCISVIKGGWMIVDFVVRNQGMQKSLVKPSSSIRSRSRIRHSKMLEKHSLTCNYNSIFNCILSSIYRYDFLDLVWFLDVAINDFHMKLPHYMTQSNNTKYIFNTLDQNWLGVWCLSRRTIRMYLVMSGKHAISMVLCI